jgi:hypothetical protein
VTSIDDVRRGLDKVKQTGHHAVLVRIADSKGEKRFIAVPIQ